MVDTDNELFGYNYFINRLVAVDISSADKSIKSFGKLVHIEDEYVVIHPPTKKDLSSMDEEVLLNLYEFTVLSPTIYNKNKITQLIEVSGQKETSEEILEYVRKIIPADEIKIPEADTPYKKS